MTRFIQHKTEARWFYRVVSLGYDRWINPLFWTAPMRDAALALARLDDPGLEVVDVGAGTGFATEAIVRTVAPERVTMLDQSPHQLARAQRKPALGAVRGPARSPALTASRLVSAAPRPPEAGEGALREATTPTATIARVGVSTTRVRVVMGGTPGVRYWFALQGIPKPLSTMLRSAKLTMLSSGTPS
jgi:hypothetical protein